MRPRKYQVKLKKQEKEYLEKFISTGVRSAREITRARILLLLNAKLKNREIVAQLKLSPATICAIAKKYCTEGLETALKDRARPGQPKKVHLDTEAAIIALSCSKSPEGRSKWTLRLLRDKIIELGILDEISHVQVHNILKKANLNRG